MDKLWVADLGNETYKNPILFADYSDPDVIRVGDTFYMTASSFNYIPGLPILTSKDLVNWELVNYALKRIDYDDYNLPQHARGVWAPAIRYHDGRFYIYYGMPDEGIFMVSTTDPLGDWDAPVLVLEGKGLIDSCPFWDEDGKAYVIHGYAKSRIGFKSALGIFEMTYDGKKAIGADHILFDGQETQPTIEGPKVYKKDDFYYILAPAGGVKQGWQTALRSKNIYGPYEEKIVLEQQDTPINGPHQGALVDTINGDQWFIHFQDRGMYGRIIHMQPVNWVDGWPIMGDNGRPVLEYKKPNTGVTDNPKSLQATDDFSKDSLDLMWQWTGNSKDEFFELQKEPAALRLFAINASNEEEPIIWRSPNVLTQKLICPFFRADIEFDASSLEDGAKAGIAMIGGEYAYLAIKNVGGSFNLVYGISSEVSGKLSNGPGAKVENEQVLMELSQSLVQDFKCGLELKEGVDKKPVFNFFYSMDGEERVVEESTTFLPSDHTWVGAKIGLFAIASDAKGFADFKYIKVSN